DDGAAERIGYRARTSSPSLGRCGGSLSRKRSVAASAIDCGGCGTAPARPSRATNKKGCAQEIKQESGARGMHRGAPCSRACRLVLGSIQSASKTSVASGCDSGKIDRCTPIRELKCQSGECLLRRRCSGRNPYGLGKSRRPKGN